jgi:hypothetical protein
LAFNSSPIQAAPHTDLTKSPPSQEPATPPNQNNEVAPKDFVTQHQLYQGLSILVDYIVLKRKKGELPEKYGDDLKLLGRLIDSYPKSLGPKIEPLLKNANAFENLDHCTAFTFIAETEEFLCLAGQKEAINPTTPEEITIGVFPHHKATDCPSARQYFTIKGRLLDLKPLGSDRVCFLSVSNNENLSIGILSKNLPPHAIEPMGMVLRPLPTECDLRLSKYLPEQLTKFTLICCKEASDLYIAYLETDKLSLLDFTLTLFQIKMHSLTSTRMVSAEVIQHFYGHGYKYGNRFQKIHQIVFATHCSYLVIPMTVLRANQKEGTQAGDEILWIQQFTAPVNKVFQIKLDRLHYQMNPLKDKFAFHLKFPVIDNPRHILITLWNGKTLELFRLTEEIGIQRHFFKLPGSAIPQINFVLTCSHKIHVGLDNHLTVECNLLTNKYCILNQENPSQLNCVKTITQPLYETADCFYYINKAHRVCKWTLDSCSSLTEVKHHLTVFCVPPSINDQPRSFHKWLAGNAP